MRNDSSPALELPAVWGETSPSTPPMLNTTRKSTTRTTESDAATRQCTCATNRWRPVDGGPELVVSQGDLTTCVDEAIVNPANSRLLHGGGLAGAIIRRGGKRIQSESHRWIDRHKELPVGHAMSTSAGRLPSKFVIHTVGPIVGGESPTPEQAQQLRDAVWSSLKEADRLKVTSVAIPCIASGLFGYPRHLAAQEIVSECERYCRAMAATTTIKRIDLMNNDAITCESILQALCDAAESSGFAGTCELHQDDRHRVTRSITTCGFLPFRVAEKDFEVLVGVRRRTADSRRVVCLLGGKQNADERESLVDGCRTFSADVGGLLPAHDVVVAVESAGRAVHIEMAGSSAVVCVHLDTKKARALPDLFEQAERIGANVSEQDHLVWLPWRSLVASCVVPVQAASFKDCLKDVAGVPTPFGAIDPSPLLRSLVCEYQREVQEQFDALTLHVRLQYEQYRVKKFHQMKDEDLLPSILGPSWSLRLSEPASAVYRRSKRTPPIELLYPHDPDYTGFMAELPPHLRERVVSIRRVHVPTRIRVYEQHKKQLTGRLQDKVKELEPLYHGTPERWRATAIALHGFDIRIRIHGRSFGDGVYTSKFPSTTLSYSKSAGSILRLRSLVTSNCANHYDNTIVNNDVHVFPNPAALLPLLIADFAKADLAQANVDSMQKAAADHVHKQEAERAKFQTQMVAKQKEFVISTTKRLRSALEVYSRRLADIRQLPDASRRLFVERDRFQACLPIYEVQEQLLSTLRQHQVVIVVAETGSGKSTQLPQLLLDEVVPTSETRRIAVLQPRRINAIALCKRVSEERGVVPGQEVGYTIGRGESNVKEAVTRLEFMTHGLFVQLAKDHASLMSKYCAVVVDEAHERSVDIDLSLALLRRALERHDEREHGDFKVVVMSATIATEAEQFQRYLDATLTRSSVFRMEGRTFPVHVEHRDDIEFDRKAVGSAGAAKIQTSAAIHAAMELLQTTESGNILVFLPGEGNIHEALQLARVNVGASDILDPLHPHSSRSPSFCFRYDSSYAREFTSREETTTTPSNGTPPPPTNQKDTTANTEPPKKTLDRKTYFIGFHSKASRLERELVLFPPSSSSRFVIFTTNVAETGVTIPNVRYVIDSGLERRVRWNADLDINEMVTEQVTVSSMIQRTGRAGRTASGLCIRLYNAQGGGEFVPATVIPAVQTAKIDRVILLNKELEHRGEAALELMDSIEPSRVELVEQRLMDLGALDSTGRLSKEGEAILHLGIDLQLGQFLIACARFGCIATGVKLASLLIAADAPERLLPHRKQPEDWPRLQKFVDPSGDHITLLNIIEAYEEAERQSEGVAWTRQHGFDMDVFVDAKASRDHLTSALDDLRFPVADDAEQIERAGGRHSVIRRALCAAYYTQVAQPRMAKSAASGFTRVLQESKRTAMHEYASKFVARTQPKDKAVDNDEDDGDKDHLFGDGGSDVDDDDSSYDQDASQSEQPAVGLEPTVKLSPYSTMWTPSLELTLAPSHSLVVFTSVMLTDSATDGCPSIQLATRVSEEEVQAGAQDWCRIVDFDKLLDESARETLEFRLGPGMTETLLMQRGDWLPQLKRTVCTGVETKIRNRVLSVSCPRSSATAVEAHVRAYVQSLEPETIVLQLPQDATIGKIIGRGGQQIQSLEQGVQDLLSSEVRGAGHLHAKKQRVIKVDGDSKTIHVTLQGTSKALMRVVVSQVQSKIVELLGLEMLPVVSDCSGERGQEMQQHPRLAQLLNCMPPTKWETRDDVMMQLAHALVWKCDASICGSFLRDWVIRGEESTSIDVQLASLSTTQATMTQTLAEHLANSPHAQSKSLSIKEVAAHTLKIACEGIASIDVHLVDQEASHVACDAENLLLNRVDGLRKNIITIGGSLCEALENVRQKRFTFYASLDQGPSYDSNLQRLKQYLAHGWTCITDVPRSVRRRGLSSSERRLIQPPS